MPNGPRQHIPHNCAGSQDRGETDLLADVLLKVLVRGDVEADAAVFEPLSLHLVRRAGHGGDDDIRDREALLQRQAARVHDVPRVIAVRLSLGRLTGTFGVLLRRSTSARHRENGTRQDKYLNRVDVDGEHAGAVICQERSQWPANDL